MRRAIKKISNLATKSSKSFWSPLVQCIKWYSNDLDWRDHYFGTSPIQPTNNYLLTITEMGMVTRDVTNFTAAETAKARGLKFCVLAGHVKYYSTALG